MRQGYLIIFQKTKKINKQFNLFSIHFGKLVQYHEYRLILAVQNISSFSYAYMLFNFLERHQITLFHMICETFHQELSQTYISFNRISVKHCQVYYLNDSANIKTELANGKYFPNEDILQDTLENM